MKRYSAFLSILLIIFISNVSFSQTENVATEAEKISKKIKRIQDQEDKYLNSGILWMKLAKAEKFSKKYNTPMLIYFWRPNCEYCDRMRTETLSDPEIIKFINQNFYPVLINAKGKDTINYNKRVFFNQQPIKDGYSWRHDFFHELFEENPRQKGYIYPTTCIVDGKYNMIKQLYGFQPKMQFERGLKQSLKIK